MRNLWENGILQRILVLIMLTAMLGIAPQPHIVRRGLIQLGRAQHFEAPLSRAENLATVAEHIPWRSNLWELAGHYALLGDRPETATSYYREAAAIGSLSQDGYQEFGDAYKLIGNLYTALQIWQATIQIFGSSEGTLTRIADTQRETGDYVGLTNTLKQLAQRQPAAAGQNLTAVPLNYELGMLLAALDPPAAPPYLLQAVELDPALADASALAFTIQRALPNDNTTFTLMASGQKLADLGKWELAALAFQQAIEVQPDYEEAWAFIGEALQHLEPPVAERYSLDPYTALAKAVEINPLSLPANTFMALYWQRKGDFERSYLYLTAAEKIDPDNPDIQVDLGATTATLGNLESAVEHYWKAVELTTREPVYLRALVAFCIQYNYDLQDTALPVARQALLSDPDDPNSLDMMGQVLFRLGDLLNAQRFFLQAISHDPQFAAGYLHLGLVYNLQGKPGEAKDAFRRAITLAPGTATAAFAARLLAESTQP